MFERERYCPHCGRANSLEMPRCINCGQRMGGTVLLAKTEEPTVRGNWWQTSTDSAIPAPPQVKEEAARHEAVRRERERLIEERRQIETRQREARRAVIQAESVSETPSGRTAPLTTKTTLTHCPRCQTPLGEAGQLFSFCLHCGNDVTSQSKTAQTATRPTAATRTTQTPPNTTVTFQTAVPLVQVTTREERSEMPPSLAAFVSFLLPGLGQLFNGQASKAGLLFLLFFVLTFVLHFGLGGFILMMARVLAAIDAYRIARRRRQGRPVRPDEWDLGG